MQNTHLPLYIVNELTIWDVFFEWKERMKYLAPHDKLHTRIFNKDKEIS